MPMKKFEREARNWTAFVGAVNPLALFLFETKKIEVNRSETLLAIVIWKGLRADRNYPAFSLLSTDISLTKAEIPVVHFM